MMPAYPYDVRKLNESRSQTAQASSASFMHLIETPSKKATIYIETLPNWDPKNEPANPENVPGYYPGTFGSRFFGGVGGSQIRIHGRKMDRTWTLLR